MARPPGSYQTPEYILEKELKSWVQISNKCRALQDKIITGFEQAIEDNNLNLEGRLQILNGLKDVVSTATKVIESGTKILAAETNGKRPAEHEDPEQILAELGGGNGR